MPLQLLHRVGDEVRVLHIEHEADVGEPFRPPAMIDGVEHQHVERGEVCDAGRGGAADHPAIEGVPEQNQPELELRERRHDAGGEMGRGDDRPRSLTADGPPGERAR